MTKDLLSYDFLRSAFADMAPLIEEMKIVLEDYGAGHTLRCQKAIGSDECFYALSGDEESGLIWIEDSEFVKYCARKGIIYCGNKNSGTTAGFRGKSTYEPFSFTAEHEPLYLFNALTDSRNALAGPLRKHGSRHFRSCFPILAGISKEPIVYVAQVKPECRASISMVDAALGRALDRYNEENPPKPLQSRSGGLKDLEKQIEDFLAGEYTSEMAKDAAKKFHRMEPNFIEAGQLHMQKELREHHMHIFNYAELRIVDGKFQDLEPLRQFEGDAELAEEYW